MRVWAFRKVQKSSTLNRGNFEKACRVGEPLEQHNKIAFADQYRLLHDTRFHFIFPIPIQNLEHETPLFGFTEDVLEIITTLRKILLLPQHPHEIAAKREMVMAYRMSGETYHLRSIPLVGLPYLFFDDRTPLICFVTNKNTSSTICQYQKSIPFPILHISTTKLHSAIPVSELGLGHLCKHFESIRDFFRKQGNSKTIDLLNQVDLRNRKWKFKRLPFQRIQNLHVLPNQLVLESFGFRFNGETPINCYTDENYIQAIVNSADAISHEREIVLQRRIPKPPPFTLILTAPSFYRHVYGSIKVPEGELKPAIQFFKAVIRQKHYHLRVTGSDLREFVQNNPAREALVSYQNEIEAYSLCVAMKAANQFAPVLRVPPAVNQLHPYLDSIGRCVRGNSPHVEFKQNKLMRKLKHELTEIIPRDFQYRLDQPSNRIKIISDAPLEWIPLRGLPLMLRCETSRIPTTPGNLLFEQCASGGDFTVSSKLLQRILVVRSYTSDDPLKDLLPTALRCVSTDKLQITSCEVKDEDEFIQAFHSFPAGIVIFDGHGARPVAGRPGEILLNDKRVDVWKLRHKLLSIPPVVFLSSCDTHAMDGTHASVANSFLLLGARTVVGTVLPINARSAAIFVARLLFRLNEYLPIVTNRLDSVVRWSSIMAGLQRMAYVTELREFLQRRNVFKPSKEEEKAMAIALNWPVVQGLSDWYERGLTLIANASNMKLADLAKLVEEHFNLPESCKYIQLGNPDQILIVSNQANESLIKNLEGCFK